jgi:hypothetical protein
MKLGNKIIDLRLQNKKYSEIKEILKCSKSSISYHCSKIKKVEELKLIGKTYEEINKEIKIGIDRIKKICRKNFINKSPVLLTGKIKECKFTKEFIQNMQNYYDNGHNRKQTGEFFKVSLDSVSKYIKLRKRRKLEKEEKKKKNSENVISWRKRVKIKLVEYKGQKCEICGYDKCIQALTFHHKDPNEKDFNISGKSYSFERMKKRSR